VQELGKYKLLLPSVNHCSYHPSFISARCRTAKDDTVRLFYQRALDKPDAIIAKCEDALGEWVISNAADGKLRDVIEE
jgi:hypothetical protein